MKTIEELEQKLADLKKWRDDTMKELTRQANEIVGPVNAQIEMLEDILQVSKEKTDGKAMDTESSGQRQGQLTQSPEGS
jgi:hypothetical protein